MKIGASSCHAGWATHLSHSTGRYVLLRDGRSDDLSGHCNGEPCIYAKIDAGGYVLRDLQFTAYWPSGVYDTPNEPTLTGNPWLNEAAMAATGQSPICIPPEPVSWPPARML